MDELPVHMVVWLDKTGSDRRSDCRKYEYHLCGMTPCNFKLIAKGKCMSAIAIMSERGIEDIYMMATLMVKLLVVLLTEVRFPFCSPLVA